MHTVSRTLIQTKYLLFKSHHPEQISPPSPVESSSSFVSFSHIRTQHTRAQSKPHSHQSKPSPIALSPVSRWSCPQLHHHHHHHLYIKHFVNQLTTPTCTCTHFSIFFPIFIDMILFLNRCRPWLGLLGIEMVCFLGVFCCLSNWCYLLVCLWDKDPCTPRLPSQPPSSLLPPNPPRSSSLSLSAFVCGSFSTLLSNSLLFALHLRFPLGAPLALLLLLLVILLPL